MKRSFEEPNISDSKCRVDKQCTILCERNGIVFTVPDDPRLAPSLRNEYRKCRAKQRAMFQESLGTKSEVEESEFQPSEYSEEEEEPEINEPSESWFSSVRQWIWPSRDVSALEPGETDVTFHGLPSVDAISKAESPIPIDKSNRFYNMRQRKCRDVWNIAEFPPREQVREAIQHLGGMSEVKFAKWIGRGKNGHVFIVCNPSMASQQMVVKYFKTGSMTDMKQEWKMQKIFAENGLALPPIAFDASQHILIMAKIDGTLGDLLHRKLTRGLLDQIIFIVVDLLYRLCDAQLWHHDFHWNNIGYRLNVGDNKLQPVLIDFGWSQKGKCDPQHEIATLIYFSWDKDFDEFNQDYLRQQLMILYENNYGKAENTKAYWSKKYHEPFDLELGKM